MSVSKEELREMLRRDEFPLSAKYDPEWVMENEMGPNVLWLMEWLCQAMTLKPGMRVLDMGCGKAMSSIFLAKEFGAQVWANDLWVKPTDNWERIREAGVEDRVFPIHAEARALPYAHEFFDAIVCADSYFYYGTDDLYLKILSKFVEPGGQIGIVDVALPNDLEGPPPEHLTRPQKNGAVFWADDCWGWHTPQWWRRHWEKTGLVEVETAEIMQDGWRLWLQHEKAIDAALGDNRRFPSDIEVLEADHGRYMGLMRMVARRKGDKHT